MRLHSHNFDLEQLAKLTGRPTLPRVHGGPCDECPKTVDVRYAYGQFALCRLCAGNRLTAAAKVGAFDSLLDVQRLHQAMRDSQDGAA